MEKVEQALKLRPQIIATRTQVSQLRASVATHLDRLKPWDPEEEKRPAWAQIDEAERLEAAIELDRIALVQGLQAALNEDPLLPEAHRALAEYYQERMAESDLQGDGKSAQWECLLREHDRGEHALWLKGVGAFTLHTDPPGAEVILHRWTQRHRRLVLDEGRSLGKTPLDDMELEIGSYLLILRHPGCVPVRYPLAIERAKHWDGIAPREDRPLPIYLPQLGELAADDVYIPAGWTRYGGDPLAIDPLPAGRIWIDAFVMKCFPVTNGEYLEFLNDLVRRGMMGQALALCPHKETSDHLPLIRQMPGAASFQLAPGLGQQIHQVQRLPVVDISWWAAEAYGKWLAKKTGKPWRLPHELEWEKAGRSVDGRAFPWGEHFDPTWARVLNSTPGTPDCVQVDDYPVDESPYTVRGLGGNVRDFCLNKYSTHGPQVSQLNIKEGVPDEEDVWLVRGGNWLSAPRNARLANRFVSKKETTYNSVGFRLLQGWPINSER